MYKRTSPKEQCFKDNKYSLSNHSKIDHFLHHLQEM